MSRFMTDVHRALAEMPRDPSENDINIKAGQVVAHEFLKALKDGTEPPDSLSIAVFCATVMDRQYHGIQRGFLREIQAALKGAPDGQQ